MPRLRPVSRERDVLVRPPWLDPRPSPWRPPVVDVTDQLEELAALLRSGVLSREDFERQKRKVLALSSSVIAAAA